jgi:cytoskeletal protein CcmA (bactofilin family)
MREERGTLTGKQVIDEPLDLWGTIVGDVRVLFGGKVYVRGAIYGNLTVEDGGRVHLFGNVSGNLTVEKGAKVIASGIIGGDVVNDGGRLFLDNFCNILGHLRRLDGETKIAPKAQFHQ